MLVLHKTLVVLVFLYSDETKLWKEKRRSRIRDVQMDNLKGLLGIKRIDRVTNARIRELCKVMKGLMKVFSDGLVIWRGWRLIGLLR